MKASEFDVAETNENADTVGVPPIEMVDAGPRVISTPLKNEATTMERTPNVVMVAPHSSVLADVVHSTVEPSNTLNVIADGTSGTPMLHETFAPTDVRCSPGADAL